MRTYADVCGRIPLSLCAELAAKDDALRAAASKRDASEQRAAEVERKSVEVQLEDAHTLEKATHALEEATSKQHAAEQRAQAAEACVEALKVELREQVELRERAQQLLAAGPRLCIYSLRIYSIQSYRNKNLYS